MTPILVLRPLPGARETAARANALGLTVVVAPLFEVRPLAWEAPAIGGLDAVMLTSANAPRHAGPALDAFLTLPCYAVGEATAAEAKRRGFADVRAGHSDGAALLERVARDGVRRALHPCGRDRIPLERPGLAIERRPVYASEAVHALPPEAGRALANGVLALIHSPRAGAVFADLVDAAGLDRAALSIAAISAAAANAAGSGWMRTDVAAEPRDEALLELAAKLCKTGAMGNSG